MSSKRTHRLAYDDEPTSPRRTAAKAGTPIDMLAVVDQPSAADNAVIANRPLKQGTVLLAMDGRSINLANSILEGHRLACVPIAAGEFITSWGEPFGKALHAISAGEWLRNDMTLKEHFRSQEPSGIPTARNS